MTTIPESPETIESQLEWLHEGKRRAVLITPGCELPAGLFQTHTDLACHLCTDGLIVFNSKLVSRDEVVRHAKFGVLGELLGYGIPRRPEQPSEVITIRGANGHEKQAVTTDKANRPAVEKAARATAGNGDTVHCEDGTKVIDDRLKSLDARELKIRRFDPERDSLALYQAATDDGHRPLNPTHIILRGDQIIGYYAINSLPLYRLWFHTEKMKATDSLRVLWHIEQTYREAGVSVIATIIDTTSPFHSSAVRGGYMENENSRLFMKGLS